MRILIVTRYFPPEISGGARRPNGFLVGLRGLGVDVTLCGPDGIIDSDLIGVKHPTFPSVHGEKGLSENKSLWQHTLNWARIHLLLPDPEIRWALLVVRRIKESGRQFDWILTTSPPESLHVAGRLIKLQLGCKWVADVRDSWIERPQRQVLKSSFLRRWLERKIAHWCLQRVDALVAVSPLVLNEVVKYAPSEIPHAIIGHFAPTFEGVPEDLPAESFNLVHTGSITLSNPLSEFSILLADFEALVQERADCILWLAGNLSQIEKVAVEASSAADNIRVLGPVNSERARALQAGADALVLVSGRNSHALPGKFSEYVQTGKPILVSALGPWLDLIPSHIPIFPLLHAVSLSKSVMSHEREGSGLKRASEQLLQLLKHG